MEGIVNAIIVAKMPTTMMPPLMTHMISISDAFWRNMSLYTLRANMDAADNTEESAELITAADTAPRPKKETKSGVRYCSTIGRIMLVSDSVRGHGPRYSVSFQAIESEICIWITRLIQYSCLASSTRSENSRVAFAMAPIRTGGIAISRQPNAAT